MAAPNVLVLESEADVSSKLCDLVIDKANSAIERDGKFTVGLSGNFEIQAYIYLEAHVFFYFGNGKSSIAVMLVSRARCLLHHELQYSL